PRTRSQEQFPWRSARWGGGAGLARAPAEVHSAAAALWGYQPPPPPPPPPPPEPPEPPPALEKPEPEELDGCAAIMAALIPVATEVIALETPADAPDQLRPE